MTQSTEPEVHNMSQRRQKRIECAATVSVHKIGEFRPCIWFLRYASGQTDRQTYSSHISQLTGAKVSINSETVMAI